MWGTSSSSKAQTPKNGIAHATRASLAALGLSAAIAGANPAQAQSNYGCENIEHHRTMASVEGPGGTFFAIRPELQAHHSLSDAMVAELARLTLALRERGTELVLLPVPTRAMVMANDLPALAQSIGFVADDAIAVHEEMLGRLRAAGVTTADPTLYLRAAARAGQEPFFKVDPRPTSFGASLIAQAAAEEINALPALEGAERRHFRSVATGEVVLPSHMRSVLQLVCAAELPQTMVESHTIDRGNAVISTQGTGVLTRGSAVVLLGSDITATAPLNLAGFLSERTGLPVQSYGVADAGAYAAMSSYLTSVDYVSAPPKVLIWEWPVSQPLGHQGMQPMRELSAAAARHCTTDVPVRRSETGLVAELPRMAPGQATALEFDTGGSTATFARFYLSDQTGMTRLRSIYRDPEQLQTGRFFLAPEPAVLDSSTRVEIETDAAMGAAPFLRICR